MNTRKQKGRYTAFFVATMIGKLKRRIKKTRHRRYVLEEWLTTERNYHSDLSLAIDHIKQPMMRAEIIDKEGAYTLFP